MKKCIYGILLSLLIAGCNSPQDKAQDLIKAHLNNTMHDVSSYESVEFGALDSVFTNILSDSIYTHYLGKRLVCQKMRNELYKEAQLWRTINKERYEHYNQRCLLYSDSTGHYNQLENEAKSKFNPQFKGYVMKHSFRAKNQFGNLVMNIVAFEFDPELTHITSTCDWGEYSSFDAEREIEDLIKETLQ